MNYPRFKIGIDGFAYAVFFNSSDAWAYFEEHGGLITCFNGFENAVRLNRTLGL